MPLNVGGGDSLFFKTGIDTSGLKRGSTQAMGIVAGLTKNVSRADVFAGLGLSGVIAFGAVTVAMTKFTAEFKKNMIEVSTISDEVTADIEGVSESILELSRGLPLEAAQLAKAEYQIISAGITDVAQSLDVLTVSAELATAGLSDVFTVADALTSIMNAYGESAGTAEQISDDLFTTVRLGKITLQQLATNIGMVTGLAAQVGLEFTDLSAAIAEGTKTVRPEIFFTAIRGLLTSLIRPSEDAIKVAKALKIEWSTAALREMGLGEFLRDLSEKTGESDKILGQLVPNVRALVGLLAVARKEGKGFADAIAEFVDNVGSKNEALAKQLEETGAKTKIFWNNMKVELKGLGDVALDVIDILAEIGLEWMKVPSVAQAASEIINKGKFIGTPKSMANAVEKDLRALGVNVVDLNKRLVTIYKKGVDHVESQAAITKIINDLLELQSITRQENAELAAQDAEIAAERLAKEKAIADEKRQAAEDRYDRAVELAEFEEDREKESVKLAKLKETEDKKIHKGKLDREKELAKIQKAMDKAKAKGDKEELKDLQDRWDEQTKGIQEALQNQIRSVDELAASFSALGDFGGEYNKSLGESLELLSKMSTLVADFLSADTLGGKITAAIRLFTTMAKKLSTFSIGGRDIQGRPVEGARRRGEETEFRPNDDVLGGNIEKARQQLELTVKPLEDIRDLMDAIEAKGATKVDRTGLLFSTTQEFKRDMLALTDEINQLLTATTADSISDGIADGFASGLDSAEVFAVGFEDIMKTALQQSFTRVITDKYLNDWYARLARDIESGGQLTSEEAYRLKFGGTSEAGDYEKGFEGIVYDAEKIRDQLFGDAGLPGLLTDDADSQQTGISGRIQGITETTAGLLEGQFNAMRIDMAKMQVSMLNLDLIADNTLRTADNTELLVDINNHLKLQQTNQTSIMRSMGIS